MKNYTYEDYEKMSDDFNVKTFSQKIQFISNNKNILTLAADGNWWGVKVKDEDIQERLYDNDKEFRIENEWQSEQMYELVYLLGIGITDI